MKEFGDVLDRYLHPVLRDAGFNRSGRVFSKVAPDGNTVVVRVSESSTFTRVGFHVEWAPIPRALRDYRSNGRLEATPSILWGVFYTRLVCPAELREIPLEYGRWSYERTGDTELFGQVLRISLYDAAIRWDKALTREYVLHASRDDPDCQVQTFPTGFGGPIRTALYFDIDDGDPDELNRLLIDEERRLPGDEDIAWLRARLDRRMAANV